ncbi:hypothetical protein C492_06492 [Natronococcus jeotgali DSM 18795]|uniref:Uncharacterized protein n=1 Tax=Natronococcus jeotgali DSM 18795 TaxID=1227498 RepID=L9XU61_9EURY|nr:hypothetical protein C492_06492 [Natronococcus jeotgali DSM 18795]
MDVYATIDTRIQFYTTRNVKIIFTLRKTGYSLRVRLDKHQARLVVNVYRVLRWKREGFCRYFSLAVNRIRYSGLGNIVYLHELVRCE